MHHFVVYCSPSGSTRRVAGVIADKLADLGLATGVFDLGESRDRQELEKLCSDLPSPRCLWIGTPVYVDHMVPPVQNFIMSLPKDGETYAVPFITWGGVNSGVTLAEMGSSLMEKGSTLLGAAKVLAVHSSMWALEHPLGEGHPDSGDDAAVRKLVDAVHEKLASGTKAPLPLKVLDYQSDAIKEAARKKNIAMAKKAYAKLEADVEKCTQCGQCAAMCPAGAITLNPYPQFAEECFICLKCVRECPEGAIPQDMVTAGKRILDMAAAVNEPPRTDIFV
jgi:ferredoxin/flavodoxin